MPIRVGVIGAGYLGQHHARVYSELPQASLVGVADTDEGRAAAVAERCGCRPFRDFADLLSGCDAVSIVTPTTTHYEIAMKCLSAGKDILVEKPIAESLDHARRMIDEAGRRDSILQVGHLERYNPAVTIASSMIEAPEFIEAERLSPFLGRGTDVDVTYDLMIHDLDIILSIVKSEPTDAKAVGKSMMSKKIDVAKAWIEFENGCTALVTASRLASEKRRQMSVFQEDSYLSIDFQSQEVRRYSRAGEGISCDVIKPDKREPLKEELADFLACCADRRRPKVSGEAAAGALALTQRVTSLIRR